MKHSIYLTHPIPGEEWKRILKRKDVEFSVYEHSKIIPRKKLLKEIKGKEVVWTLLTERVDKEFFDAAGDQLKMVCNYAIGYNNVDVEEAKKRGVIITNSPAPDVSASVAEHALMLMLCVARRTVEADRYTRAGKYHGWKPAVLLGHDLSGKTMGIIGTGRIGSSLASMVYKALGMKIIYHDVNRNPRLEKATKATYRTKMQLVKEADVISVHVPLLPSTHHLISTKELKAMKKTAIVLNTSRGPVVDETALARALSKKEIGGAGLDVYECEPLIDCKPNDLLELRRMPNVVLTPHTGSATIEAREGMNRVGADNIEAYLDGKKCPNRVA